MLNEWAKSITTTVLQTILASTVGSVGWMLITNTPYHAILTSWIFWLSIAIVLITLVIRRLLKAKRQSVAALKENNNSLTNAWYRTKDFYGDEIAIYPIWTAGNYADHWRLDANSTNTTIGGWPHCARANCRTPLTINQMFITSHLSCPLCKNKTKFIGHYLEHLDEAQSKVAGLLNQGSFVELVTRDSRG